MPVKTTVLLSTLLLALLMAQPAVHAQADKVDVRVNGEPAVEGARVTVRVGVTGPEGAIIGLTPDAFTVTEAGQPVRDLAVQAETAGLAVAIVVDRGGIADQGSCAGPTGERRISEAKGIARTFVEQLVIGNPDRPDDMVALIGIGDENQEGRTTFWPDQDFTYDPVDRNLVLNNIEFLDAPERLLRPGTTTPLYEGLDRALDWLAENGNPGVRQELARRHKLVLLFSDGIDREYSDDAIELGIIDKARDTGTKIYTVGMACAGRTVDADSLQHMATQTGARYWPHDSAQAHEQILARLPELLSYSQQYRVAFTTHLPNGEYTLRVRAETAQGADEDTTRFLSPLRRPEVNLLSPQAGLTVTETVAVSTTLPVTASFTFPDEVPREMAATFSVDGTPVFTTTNAPYRYDWNLAGLASAAHTLRVQATDPLLPGESPLTAERTIEIVPEPTPAPAAVVPTATPRPVVPPVPGGQDTGTLNNLLLWLVPLLLAAVGALLFVLMRTRQQVATAVSSGVRRMTTHLTRVLPGPQTQPARARLLVTRGPGRGREYRLHRPVTSFGRDDSAVDETLEDAYVSAHHFSIRLDEEEDTFAIMDANSRNGTFVNGQRLPAKEYVPLPPGSSVRAGESEFTFKRIGGPTQMLESDRR